MKNNHDNVTITKKDFDAVIFDLDGVVTKTMSTHAAAWKKAFDDFLARHKDSNPAAEEPFNIEKDYMIYVDGKPRLEGIKSFLQSRNINLPEGNPKDAPGFTSIHAIGNLKNGYFLEQIKKRGVEVYQSTLEFIRKLKAQGIKTGIISSSKNCALILDSSGLAEMFDVRVDGVDLIKLKIPGKPAPDMFEEAARQLGVEPSRTAVVEDAVSGVEAAKAGNFGLVIGIARLDNKKDLLNYGAHVVVNDASEISVEEDTKTAPQLPSAIDNFAQIKKLAAAKRVAIFLDYDGTLTPIVDTPEKAILSPEMRKTVIDLSQRCPVGIISGRDMQNVKNLVDIDSLIYAGSHGFEITGPSGIKESSSKGMPFLPILDEAEKELCAAIGHIKGLLVERKKFAIAVHYRLVDPAEVPDIEHTIDEVSKRHKELRKAYGKKVFELQPNIDWHKGKALLFLLEALGLDDDSVLPVYIGDDVTDEDALRALKDKGIGIVVWDKPFPTAAKYSLKNTDEVRKLLSMFIPLCGGAHE
ncbi:MAG TPA: trehalose-phosphatase [Deltaproteobacteria bacterium]|nr:trehalose-phosphatase [Deltaproteobacteria bacterium]